MLRRAYYDAIMYHTTQKRRNNIMTIEHIEAHPVYKQVLNDSFGGMMYDVANQGKYDAADIIKLWDELTESQRGIADGIMEGAIGFLKGEE